MTHWEIVHTSEVEKWLASTDMQLRRAVEMKVSLLRITGQGPIRILFCFDPDRRAVLLIAGMKSSQKNWYQKMIPRADELMDQYLEERQ